MATAAEAAQARDAVEAQAQLLYAAAAAYIAQAEISGTLTAVPSASTAVVRAADTMAKSLKTGFPDWYSTPGATLGTIEPLFGELLDELLNAKEEPPFPRPPAPPTGFRKRWSRQEILEEIVQPFIGEIVGELTKSIWEQALDESRDHWQTVTERVRRDNPAATARDIAKVFRADTSWQHAAARTAATRLSATVPTNMGVSEDVWRGAAERAQTRAMVIDTRKAREARAEGAPFPSARAAEIPASLIEAVNKTVGEKHRLVWISRGDSKVRTSHRRLHGKVRKPGSSFKEWETGQKLAFPGDPRAPLDEIINCRCALILVPESSAHRVADTFQVSDEDFDAVAAAGSVLSQAESDLLMELSASDS
ncbi:MAG TPA: hypothetical protein VH482_14845 [Thermomicrobiales bacterium]|jgi:hypothetical protein